MTSYVKKFFGGFKQYFSPTSPTENNHSNSWERAGSTTANSTVFTFQNPRKRRAPTSPAYEEPFSPELTDDEDQGGDSNLNSNSVKNRIGYPAKKPKYSPGALSVGAHNNIFSFGSTSTPYSMKKQDFEVLRSGQGRFSGMGTRGVNSENRNSNNTNLMGKTQSRPMSIFGDNAGFTSSSLGQQNHKKSNFGQLKSSPYFPTRTPIPNSVSRYASLPVKTSNGGTTLRYPILETTRKNGPGIEEVTLDGEDDNIHPKGQNKSSTYKLDKGTTKTVGNRFGKKTPVKKSQGISGSSCSASWWASLFDNKSDSVKTAATLKEKQSYKSMVEQVQNSQLAEYARQPWMSDLVSQRTSSSRLIKSSAPLHPAYHTATATIAEIPVLRKEKKETTIPIVRSNEPHELVKELFKTFDASVSDEELFTPPPSSSNKLAQRKDAPWHLPSSKANSKSHIHLYSVPTNHSHSRIRSHADTPRRVGYGYGGVYGYGGHSGRLHPGVTVRSKSTQSEEETDVISLTSGESATELESDSSRSLSSRLCPGLNIGENTKNGTKSEECDDDIKILSENIICPGSRRNSIKINSLELETSQSLYASKSWLNERDYDGIEGATFYRNADLSFLPTSSRFKEDVRRRDDHIREEDKKIVILHTESDLKNDLDKRMRDQLTLTDIILLEPAKPELPEITEEMQLDIERALKYGNPNEVLANVFNIQVTRGDLKTLAPSQWLNDNVINTYMDMIAERSRNEKGKFPSVHVFTTFFYPKFLKEGYSNVLKRWTRKVDIFSFDLLIFPIHLGIHWCLAVADLRHKTIRYFDSLLGNQTMCVNALLRYLSFEMRERKKTELNSKEWKLEVVKNIPTQENGSDCGVFTCKFAEYLSRDSELTFKQENMVYYRHRMIYEIMKQHLMFP